MSNAKYKHGGDAKFCGNHLQPEYFPLTYSFCPYCGQDLEINPEYAKERKENAQM